MDVWRARPVFLTSTFRDMHAERDWLRTRVFPELAERLRQRFHHLEVIDLRWGVDSASLAEEADRERLVLTVCLNEIERSRPFLVGLLGDRYGWAPPVERLGTAVRESGIDDAHAGTSVTELEILHGVLGNPAQQQRSWFYLREPLPYASMPPELAARYSDAYAGSAAAVDQVARLAALKKRLQQALPGRVRSYVAQWDAASGSVGGLEAWGAQVLEDLWSDLEQETAPYLRKRPPTWQEQDRGGFEEFVESRVRGFVGRHATSRELLEFASGTASATDWGRCVAGESGSGKSALLGHVYRQLQRFPDIVVLAHAAGISVHSSRVERMLRRWIAELAAVAQQSDPVEESTGPDEVRQVFSRMLHAVAARHRVVILVDALDQFESTVQALHLTWLPLLWPANVRLVATAIPGVQSGALAERAGVTVMPLPSFGSVEAADMVRELCERYRRALNPRVVQALLEKTRNDGSPASSNPLWLELATEELNLLGADDFEQADARFASVPDAAERIVQLLLTVVSDLPGEVQALYVWIMDETAARFGVAWTDAILGVLATSRSGWRESDLAVLVPAISGERWDPLRFAVVRRAFRSHLLQRGAHTQWDMTHLQMRAAALARLGRKEGAVPACHFASADHLLALERADALHETETMVHLMRGGDRERAAAWYGNDDLTAAEGAGATAALRDVVVAGGVDAVTALVAPATGSAQRGVAAERFLFGLDEALARSATTEARDQVARAARDAFLGLVQAEPDRFRWQRNLSVGHDSVGTMRVALGDLAGALAEYREAQAINARMAAADPGNTDRQRDLAISHHRLSDVYLSKGDLEAAQAAAEATHAITLRLAAANPDNTQLQRDLAVAHFRIAGLRQSQGKLKETLASYRETRRITEQLLVADPDNSLLKEDLASTCERIGRVHGMQGESAAALDAHRRALALTEALVAADPAAVKWQQALAVHQMNMGDSLAAQGNLPAAQTAYRKTHQILERLVATDPGNTLWPAHLATSHDRVGVQLAARGDLTGARAAYLKSLELRGFLAAADATNAEWQRAVAVSHNRLGELEVSLGDLAAAQAAGEAANRILRKLAATDARNATWRSDLAVTCIQVGDLAGARGRFAEAMAAYREALALQEELTAADPQNAGWQRSLSIAHERIGNLAARQGDRAAARAAHMMALGLRARLADADPASLLWRSDLAISHTCIGDIEAADGNWAAARSAYRAGLVLREQLVAADPHNVEWQAGLAVSHEKTGEASFAQGDLLAALAAYEETLAASQRLVAADPGNVQALNDLAIAHLHLGDVHAAQDHLERAQSCYEAALPLIEQTTAVAPENARWQSDLAAVHERIGNTRLARKDPAGAHDAYAQSLARFETLAAANPGDPLWQHSLATAHHRVGIARARLGDPAGAQAAHLAGLALAEALAASNPDHREWQRDRVVSFDLLAEVASQAGDPAAKEFRRRCLEALRHMRSRGLFLDPQLVKLLGELEAKE